jgi:1,4-alpha-glucan branching enzyme
LVALNFAAVAHPGYRVGVMQHGIYQEILNTDARIYGGSGAICGQVRADSIPHLGYPCSIVLELPPLTGLVLAYSGENQDI